MMFKLLPFLRKCIKSTSMTYLFDNIMVCLSLRNYEVTHSFLYLL